MADLNGTVSGGQKITGTVEPQAQKLRGAIRLSSGGSGGVTDVWQNGESVLDGTIGKVTVPTNTSDLTNDSGFITTETDPVFGASAAKNITSSNISTWNGKQDALVSGTNIKTVNNTSLLGSGNVAVQETLVSGTNIKTINNNSLLGSGNIVIQGGGGSTVSYTQTQTSGNELGTITIDGDSKKIYSPTETDPVFSASAAHGITSSDITNWNGKAGLAFKTIAANGTDIVADSATDTLTLSQGSNVTITGNASTDTITIAATDTTYESKTAASGGTAVSLCTTGEKYTWNGKQDELVSGTNIKTINNNSLLGSGNISISGGGGDTVTYTATVSSGTELGNIKINGSDNKVYAPTIPSNVSAFTNDSGYLTSYTETDPIFTASVAYGISSGDISSWNAKQSAITSTTTTISVANWNATTTCTKSVTGVTSSNSVIVTPAPSSISTWAGSGVYCSGQGSGTLTFTASSTPSSDITVNVMIIN